MVGEREPGVIISRRKFLVGTLTSFTSGALGVGAVELYHEVEKRRRQHYQAEIQVEAQGITRPNAEELKLLEQVEEERGKRQHELIQFNNTKINQDKLKKTGKAREKQEIFNAAVRTSLREISDKEGNSLPKILLHATIEATGIAAVVTSIKSLAKASTK